MAYYFKILNVLLLSTVKYFYTPIYAHMIGLGYLDTVVTMTIGGVIGFLIYYHFSKIVIVSTKHLKPFTTYVVPYHLRKRYNNYTDKRRLRKKNKKVFTRRNRFLVKVARHYGMYTIILLTPILISLILGAFLLRKYYGNKREAVPLMLVSIIVEGIIIISGYWYIRGDLLIF